MFRKQNNRFSHQRETVSNDLYHGSTELTLPLTCIKTYLSCSGTFTHSRDCRSGWRTGTWGNSGISHTEAKIMGLAMIRFLQERVKKEEECRPECRHLNLMHLQVSVHNPAMNGQ